MLAVKHTTAAVLVKRGPCGLYAVALAGTGDAATCRIVTACWQPGGSVAMARGIYVALTGTTPDVSVAYG